MLFLSETRLLNSSLKASGCYHLDKDINMYDLQIRMIFSGDEIVPQKYFLPVLVIIVVKIQLNSFE